MKLSNNDGHFNLLECVLKNEENLWVFRFDTLLHITNVHEFYQCLRESILKISEHAYSANSINADDIKIDLKFDSLLNATVDLSFSIRSKEYVFKKIVYSDYLCCTTDGDWFILPYSALAALYHYIDSNGEEQWF